MANPQGTEPGWRSTMSREDRVKVCQHIMGKLGSYYSMVPPTALREKTSAFESQAYTNAESRTDYLKRIAAGLSNVERQFQQSLRDRPPGYGGGPNNQAIPGNPVTQAQGVGIGRQLPQGQKPLQQRQQQRQQQLPQNIQSHQFQQLQVQAQQRLLLQQQQQAAAAATAKQQQQLQASKQQGSVRQKSMPTTDVKVATSRAKSTSNAAAASAAGGRPKPNQINLPNQNVAKSGAQSLTQPRGNSFVPGQTDPSPAVETPGDFLMSLAPHAQQGQSGIQAGVQHAAQHGGQLHQPSASDAISNISLDQQAANRQGNRQQPSVPTTSNIQGFPQQNFQAEQGRAFGVDGAPRGYGYGSQQNPLLMTGNIQGSVPGSGASAGLPTGSGEMSQAQNVSRALSLAAQGHPSIRGIPLEKQKQMQMQRMAAAQGSGIQGPIAGQSGGQNAFSRAVAVGAGMTVPQMNAVLGNPAAQSTNSDKLAPNSQRNYAAFADVFRSDMRTGQQGQAQAQGQIPPQSNMGIANPPAGSDEEFWTKLESLRTNYRPRLVKFVPIIKQIQNRQPPEKQQHFMKHLKDCFGILSLQRQPTIPDNLNMRVLEKVEKYIINVIEVYSAYIKGMVNNSAAAPAQRENLSQSIDNVRKGTNIGDSSLSSQQQFPGMTQKPGGTVHEQSHGPSHQAQQQHQMQLLKQLHLQRQQQQQLEKQHQQGAAGSVNRSAMAAVTKTAVSKAAARSMQQQRGGINRLPHQAPGAPQHQQAFQATQLGLPVSASSEQLAAALGTPYGNTTSQATAAAAAMSERTKMLHQRAQQALQAQALQQQGISAQQVSQNQHLQALQLQQAQQIQQNLKGRSQTMHPSQAQLQQLRLQQQRQQALLMKNRNKSGVSTGDKMTSGLHANAEKARETQWANSPRTQSDLPSANANVGQAGSNAAQVIESPVKRAEVTLQQRMKNVQATVQQAVDQAQCFETYLEREMKRGKNERIQNTLAALRNGTATNGNVQSSGTSKPGARPFSHVDVEHFPGDGDVIKSKTVFECSSDVGLRLAKRPKNEAADLKSLREAVEADCNSARERNPLLDINISEEFGQPVVTCQLLIQDIKLPKLVLRVQRGYPRKGGATFGFERPPLGWVGVLDEIRTRFKMSLSNAPAASVGVAAFLDAWVREAETVIEKNLRGHAKEKKDQERSENEANPSLELIKQTE